MNTSERQNNSSNRSHPNNTSGPIVKAVDVHKWFGNLHVLKGISLSVEKGEVLCLIGPSGAGKSTFLRCVNHLESIQEGRIWVDGHLVGYREGPEGELIELPERKIAQQRRDLGMVFQSFNLFWHRTLLENVIEAPVHVLGRPREEAEEQARALLARVGLSDKLDAYPRKLSGGQQQRGAIARALAMNPSVMLFDEPTSALDPETIGEVLVVMEDLARDGMTMLVVTHEMGFARKVADRIIMMDEGRIVEDAETEAFFSTKRSERHQEFLEKIL